MRKLLKVDIQEKIVPVSATQGGVKGFRYKDTTTGQLVGGFVPVDQLTPAQTSEISKYIAPAGAKDFKGYQGYKLDPSALSASPGPQGAQAASPGAQGPQAAAPGPQGAQAASPGPQGAQAASPGAQGAQAASPGAQGAQAASPGAQGAQAAPPKPRPRPVPVKSRRQQELDAINADKTLSPREKWEKANPGLAAAQREREAIRGTSETDNPLMSGLRSAMPSPSTALDPKAFKADLAKSKIKPSAYSSLLDNPRRLKFTDSYDLVLDYLLSEGHADTVDEAHYVMMQLDSEYIQSIVEDSAPVPSNPSPVDRPKPKDTKKPPTDGERDRPLVPPGGFGDLSKPRDRYVRIVQSGGTPIDDGTLPPNHDPNKYKKGKPTPGKGEVAPKLPDF